jgi:hypothetical protein
MHRGNRREGDGWVKAVIKRWGNLPSKELIGVKPFRPKISINRLEYLVCKAFEVKKEELEKPGYNNIDRQYGVLQ